MTLDTAKTGEIIPYELDADGSTISDAQWTVSAGASITAQVDLPASSTVLVSFPVAGKFKIVGTITFLNGAKLIGVTNVTVSNP
jgi:hypothetical protein